MKITLSIPISFDFSRVSSFWSDDGGKHYANRIEHQYGGNMALVVWAIAAERTVELMRKHLTHMVNHSSRFRAYLGIRTLRLSGGPLLYHPNSRQLRIAPQILAHVATLDGITATRAARALARLEELFAERRALALSDEKSEALICLAVHLGCMHADLAERAFKLIENGYPALYSDEQRRRIDDAYCALEPVGPRFDMVASARMLGGARWRRRQRQEMSQ